MNCDFIVDFHCWFNIDDNKMAQWFFVNETLNVPFGDMMVIGITCTYLGHYLHYECTIPLQIVMLNSRMRNPSSPMLSHIIITSPRWRQNLCRARELERYQYSQDGQIKLFFVSAFCSLMKVNFFLYIKIGDNFDWNTNAGEFYKQLWC